jgi:putative signal transducing protein
VCVFEPGEATGGGLPDIVVIARAKTPMQAQLIVSILRAEGIPAYVGGALLQDEFAMSQALLGMSGTTIEVPRDCADEARRVLAEARASGGSLGDDIS